MKTGHSSYYLVTGYLALSLAFGLGFSVCPGGFTGVATADTHCHQESHQSKSSCPHSTFSGNESDSCISGSLFQCVSDAVVPSQQQTALDTDASPGLHLTTAETAFGNARPAYQAPSARTAFAGGVPLHLLYRIWLN